jgi:hypothetical protein
MATMNNPGNKVPGFGFLQDLMKSAGASMPGMGAWIAPTLDPDELSKRIDELRTVQFWLEQNAKLIATSIQALEVQRMTLSTLKNLNVQVGDIGEALKIKVPTPAAPSAPSPTTTQKRQRRTQAAADPGAAAQNAPSVVDPMQWWGALTQQFSELAAQAVKDTGADTLAKAAAAPPAQAVPAAKAATAAKRAAAAARPARRRKP